MDETIVVKQSRKGAFLYICGALGMVLLSLFILFADLTENPLKQILFKAIGAFGFLLFSYCSVCLVKKALSGKALLTVTPDGITDNSSELSFGFIPWSGIERIYLDSMMDNVFIEIQLKNEEAYIGKLRGIRKWAVLVNRRMGHQAVCITLNSSGVSPKDMIGELQRRHLAAQ